MLVIPIKSFRGARDSIKVVVYPKLLQYDTRKKLQPINQAQLNCNDRLSPSVHDVSPLYEKALVKARFLNGRPLFYNPLPIALHSATSRKAIKCVIFLVFACGNIS